MGCGAQVGWCDAQLICSDQASTITASILSLGATVIPAPEFPGDPLIIMSAVESVGSQATAVICAIRNAVTTSLNDLVPGSKCHAALHTAAVIALSSSNVVSEFTIMRFHAVATSQNKSGRATCSACHTCGGGVCRCAIAPATFLL